MSAAPSSAIDASLAAARQRQPDAGAARAPCPRIDRFRVQPVVAKNHMTGGRAAPIDLRFDELMLHVDVGAGGDQSFSRPVLDCHRKVSVLIAADGTIVGPENAEPPCPPIPPTSAENAPCKHPEFKSCRSEPAHPGELARFACTGPSAKVAIVREGDVVTGHFVGASPYREKTPFSKIAIPPGVELELAAPTIIESDIVAD